MIEKAQTPNFDKIVRHNWPDNYNEESYAQVSTGEVDAAGRTVQGTSGVQQMRATTDETMTGETQEAADETFSLRSTNLGQRGEFHGNRAVTAGLLATNIANTKAQLNAVAASFETQSEQLKVQAVAGGWTQKQTQDEHDKIVQEHQDAADKIGSNFEQSNNELNSNFVEGGDPKAPDTMASPPAGGSGGDEGGSGAGLNLPPEVGQQMQQLLGQGAGMAQGAAGQLGQLGSHTPGSDVINPAVQQLGQLLQGASGGDQAQVTPEALDQLLSGQDSGGNSGGDSAPASGGDTGGGDQAAPDPGTANATTVANSTDTGGHSPHGGGGTGGTAPGAPGGGTTAPGGGGGGGTAPGGGGGGGNAAPGPGGGGGSHHDSPASQPVSAAPPASASSPTTQLSGDTATVAPPASDTGTGTQLSGAGTATAPQASSLSNPSSVMGSGSALGSGAALGGTAANAGMMGGSPMMGGGVAGAGAGAGVSPSAGIAGPSYHTGLGQPASAPVPQAPVSGPGGVTNTSGTAPQTPLNAPPTSVPAQGNTQAPNLAQPGAVSTSQREGGIAGGAMGASGAGAGVVPFPVEVQAPADGTIYHPASQFSALERSAGTVISALIASFARGGLVGPIGVAILEDHTSVFCTADGLGVIPHNTRLPENVIPLSEFPSLGELFRTDMTGCLNPGYVLKVASEVGLIPPARVIVATDEGTPTEGVTKVTTDMLKGAPYLNTPITRDMFSGVTSEDVPLALESLKQMWDVEPDTSDTVTTDMDLFNARWDRVNTEDAVPALVRYLLTDAQASVENGYTSEAAYVLRQLLYLPEPKPSH